METQTVQEAFQRIFDGFTVRVVTINGEGWIVAADIAKALGLTNARQNVAEFEEDEKGVYPLYTPGGTQSFTVLSEPGIYRLLMRTDKFTDPEVGPKIRKFQRWVTHEVLPSIRKTGSYSAPQIAVPQTFPEALRLAADLAEKVEAQEKALALAAPKVEAFEDLISTQGAMLIRDAVKVIPGSPGQFKAYELLREIGVIMPHSTEPYQKYVDDGYFIRRTRAVGSNKDRVAVTTYVTPRGLDFLRKRLGEQA